MSELNKHEAALTPQHDDSKLSANKNRLLYIVIGVAVVLIAVVWIWKSVEIGNIEKQAKKDKQSIKEQATKQITQSHEAHLKLLAKAYVWAVRTEMMQGNINQVNLFANDMVKEKNFQRIAVANDKGIIVSSTNKKDEGQPFSTLGTDAALTSNATGVQNMNDSIMVMTTPIMGFNNRLGTLYIKYAVNPPAFNN